MSEYHNLLHVIKARVCENRKISHSAYYAGSQQDEQIKNRTALIFILEVVLHEHRMKYATIFTPMEGKVALHHLIFIKTKWLLSDIRKLTLDDALLVVQDELKPERINAEAQDVLSALKLPSVAFLFEDAMEEDWDPKENAVYLQSLMLKALQ